MTSRSLLAALILAASLSLGAPLQAAPADITFSTDQSYPESVSWSAAQQAFFVSSVRHGQVGRVSPDGRYTPFITADHTLVSAVGVLADDARNTLWVANADPGVGDRTSPATQGKLAGIAAYDATTGKRRAYYDLGSLKPGAHFANDMAVAGDGSVYVTDSFAPILYRIDPHGNISIFAENPLFGSDPGFNLNGIAWHPDGYLLVGKYNSGDLFRVDLAHPDQVDRVQLPDALKGADGFHLLDPQHLMVAQNLGIDRIVELQSTDGWKSATIIRARKSQQSMPTAATVANGTIYVLDSRLDTLFDPKAAKVGRYTLEKF